MNGTFSRLLVAGLAAATVLTAASSPAHAAAPVHTLTVRGTAPGGRPDTGDWVILVNMDNFRRLAGPVGSTKVFAHGSATFSVPAGHYLAIGVFPTFGPDGPVRVRLIVDPSVTVTGNTTIATDARLATDRVTFRTPRPAVLGETDWTLWLADSTGQTASMPLKLSSSTSLMVNTTTVDPAAGLLRVLAGGWLASPASVKSPYRYDLAFTGPPEVIADQTYTATPASLATITARYYTDAAGRSGIFSRDPGYRLLTGRYTISSGFPLLPFNYGFPTPVQRTEYVSAGDPRVYWHAYLTDGAYGDQSDATRTYFPHEQTAEEWNAYPLHAALAASVLGNADLYPTPLSVTRAGDVLSFAVAPFGDNTPGHTTFQTFPWTGSYELDRNGVRIAAGVTTAASDMIAASITVPPARSTFRLILNASRSGAQLVLATRTRTVWTWRSARQSGTTLPHAWLCAGGLLSRDCASQPLMGLNFAVAGMSLAGAAPPGAQRVKIGVVRQQLSAAASVTVVSAWFSLDGGKSWRPASVTGSGAAWSAAFTAPAGSKVSLKVSATDTAGGMVTETMPDGYAVSR